MASILVVDDEIYARTLMCEILARRGHRTAPAVNGMQALQVLEEQGPFDAVVTDLRMPILDGLGLARAMADLRHDGPLPVILVSADPSALEARGIFTAIPKPIDAEALAAAVDAALLYRSCASRSAA